MHEIVIMMFNSGFLLQIRRINHYFTFKALALHPLIHTELHSISVFNALLRLTKIGALSFTSVAAALQELLLMIILG